MAARGSWGRPANRCLPGGTAGSSSCWRSSHSRPPAASTPQAKATTASRSRGGTTTSSHWPASASRTTAIRHPPTRPTGDPSSWRSFGSSAHTTPIRFGSCSAITGEYGYDDAPVGRWVTTIGVPHTPASRWRTTRSSAVGQATAIRDPRTAMLAGPIAPDPTVAVVSQLVPRVVETRAAIAPAPSLRQVTATVIPVTATIGSAS